MKTLLDLLLFASLTSSLSFGQKFQDLTAKGAPASVGVKHDLVDMGPYGAVRNQSSKGIIAFVAVIKSTDNRGQVLPCTGRADYIFKSGVLAPQEERFACLMEAADRGAKVVETVGAVVWIQFGDGSTWGDAGAGQQVLAARPKRFAYLKHLVETYYESGEDAFGAALNDPKLGFPEFAVAGCLKSDAEYEKISTIDLAKTRLATAQEWRALGIF